MDERDGSMYKLKSSWWLALSGATKEGRSATTALLLAILRRRPTLDGVPSRRAARAQTRLRLRLARLGGELFLEFLAPAKTSQPCLS